MESELKTLIRRAGQSEPEAADTLSSLLYHELHRLAEHQLRRAGGSAVTIGATTLLHEAYLNVAGRAERSGDVAFADRARLRLGVAS